MTGHAWRFFSRSIKIIAVATLFFFLPSALEVWRFWPGLVVKAESTGKRENLWGELPDLLTMEAFPYVLVNADATGGTEPLSVNATRASVHFWVDVPEGDGTVDFASATVDFKLEGIEHAPASRTITTETYTAPKRGTYDWTPGTDWKDGVYQWTYEMQPEAKPCSTEIDCLPSEPPSSIKGGPYPVIVDRAAPSILGLRQLADGWLGVEVSDAVSGVKSVTFGTAPAGDPPPTWTTIPLAQHPRRAIVRLPVPQNLDTDAIVTLTVTDFADNATEELLLPVYPVQRQAQMGAGGPWPAEVNHVGGQEQAVNLRTGNGYFSHSELSLPAYTLSLDVTRSYNHQNRRTGLLGWGWRLNLENGLELFRKIPGLSREIAVWQDDSGTEYEFQLAGLGSVGEGDAYPRVDGIRRDWPRLSAEGKGYRLRWPDGQAIVFDDHGRMDALLDQHDDPRVTYGYSPESGLLSTVSAVGTGRTLELRPNDQGLLKTIIVKGSDGSEESINFAYSDGNLTSVTGLNGRDVNFGYDSAHRLKSMTHWPKQADGSYQMTDIGWQYTSQNRLYAIQSERDDVDLNTRKNIVESREVSYHTESGYAVVIDPAGNTVFEWDGEGRLSRSARELKHYDDEGNPIESDWLSQRFEYEGHDLTLYEDPLGRQTHYTYDEGRVASVALPDKQTKRVFVYERYPDGRLKTQRAQEVNLAYSADPVNETTTTFNAYGEPVSVSGPYIPGSAASDRMTTQSDYNSNGQLIRITDPWGFVTEADYENGQLSGTTDWPMAVGIGSRADENREWSRTEYDGLGQVSRTITKMFGTDNLTTEYKQNYSTGRLTVTHYQPAGAKEEKLRDSETVVDYRRTYADVNAPVQVTRQYLDDRDDQLVAAVYRYNRSGMLLRSNTGEGEFVRRYDALGNIVLEIDRGKPTGSLDAASVDNIRQYTYDSAGRVTRAENALTGYIEYQYDAAGRLKQEDAFAPQPLKDPWDYPSLDNPNPVPPQDLKVDSVTYKYDDLDRWVYANSPVSGEQTVTYDMQADGLHVTMTKQNKDPFSGETHPKDIVDVYDPLGRLTERSSGYESVSYRLLKRSEGADIPSDTKLAKVIELPAIEATRIEYDRDTLGVSSREILTMHLDGRGRTVAETTAAAFRTRKDNTNLYYYDGYDRPVGGEVPDENGSTRISFYAFRDALGQVYSERTDDVTRRYQYNLLGNPLWEGSYKDYSGIAGAKNTYYSYSYGDVTHLNTVSYGSGLFSSDPSEAVIDESYSLDYGDDGFVSAMNSGAQKLLGFEWDRMGNLSRFCRGDGQTEQCGRIAYDRLGRQTSIDTPGTGYRPFRWQTPPVAPVNNDQSAVSVVALPGLLAMRTADVSLLNTSTTSSTSQSSGLVFDKVYSGFVMSEKHPDGTVTQRVVDPDGNVVAEVDNLGAVTRYEYDLNGHLKAKTDAKGVRTQYRYDGRGRILAETDGLGHTTTYEYRDEGRTVVKRDPLGHETSVLSNMRGLPIEETDANGHTTKYRYDSMGHLVTKTSPSGAVTSYEYDAVGNMVRVVDPRGKETVVTRDALGRATAIRDGEGHTEYYKYNAWGKVSAYTNREGQTTTYEYTNAGRISQMKDPLGNITHFEYNTEGQLWKVRDGAENGTVYTYNNRGWLQQVEEDGKITAYQYDAVGRLTYQLDGEGRETWYTYDTLGRLRREQFGSDLFVEYDYDNNGNLRTKRDSVGGATSYLYDANNRVTRIDYANGNWVSYTYDAVGNKLTESGPAGTTIYTYTADNRVATVQFPGGSTTEYQYDPAGNVAKVLVDGKELGYQYDGANRVKEITDSLGYKYQYEYDKDGYVTAIHLPNQLTTHTEYDKHHNIVRQWTDGAGTSVSQGSYQYEGRNFRQSVTEDGRTYSAVYDSRNQMSQVTNPLGDVIRYNYDKAGNLTQRSAVIGGAEADRHETITVPDLMVEILLHIKEQEGDKTDGKGAKGASAVGAPLAMAGLDSDTGFVIAADGKGIENRNGNGNANGNGNGNANGNGSGNANANGSGNANGNGGGNANGNGKSGEHGGGPGKEHGRGKPDLSGAPGCQALTRGNGKKVGLYRRCADELGFKTGLEQNILSILDNLVNGEYYLPPGDKEDLFAAVRDVASGYTVVGMTYQYNDKNQLTSRVNLVRDETHAYKYDERGNMTSNGRSSFTWDAENRLTQSLFPDGEGVRYTYDVMGRRTSQTSFNAKGQGLHTTYYDYEGNSKNVARERNKDGEVVAAYTYDLQGRPLTITFGGQTYWYVFNAHGDVVSLADSAGAVKARYEYDEWGRMVAMYDETGRVREGYGTIGDIGTGPTRPVIGSPVPGSTSSGGGKGKGSATLKTGTTLADTGSTTPTVEDAGEIQVQGVIADADDLVKYNPYRYGGYRYDRDTQYYYLQTRYYDGRLARFLSQDSWQGNVRSPLTLNRYIYAINNPINYVDPNGQFPWLVVGGILILGALVGAGIAYHNSDGDPWKTFQGAMVGLLASAGLLLAGWALAATAELIATVSLSFLAALPVGAQMAWFRFADMLYQFETQHPIVAGALYAGLESAIAYLFIADNPNLGGFVLSFVMGAALFGAMVGAQWLIGKAYNAYMASALRQTVINGMNRMALQVRMGFDSTMELFGRPKPLAYIGGRPVYAIQGGALDHPLGFESMEQWNQVAGDLYARAAAAGASDAIIGVRGSSVTGVGFKSGLPFGPHSDIDFFVISDDLISAYQLRPNANGRVSIPAGMTRVPGFADWSEETSALLGRNVAPAIWTRQGLKQTIQKQGYMLWKGSR